MEKGITGSIDWLLQHGGIYGVIIIGLVLALILLWRELKAKDTKLEAKDTVIAGLQEKRLVEGRESLMALQQTSTALNNLTDIIGLLKRDKDSLFGILAKRKVEILPVIATQSHEQNQLDVELATARAHASTAAARLEATIADLLDSHAKLSQRTYHLNAPS